MDKKQAIKEFKNRKIPHRIAALSASSVD